MKLSNEIVVEKAKENGFNLVGFAHAEELKEESKNLSEWLNRGYHAGMKYMNENQDKRKDIKKIFSSAQSIISLGMNYFSPEKYSENKNMGKISRYAWGKDYHLVMWEKLDNLIYELQKIDNTFKARVYVDTGPVMDKAWAVRTGIGWLGKHTNVINKDFGSWFFIGDIITNFEFKYNLPIEDFCGSCTACIEACPTDAIVEEYVLDANKCISYLTIENKNEIPEKFRDKFENWIFGCDICQDVCPWNNKFSEVTSIQEFFPYDGNKEILIDEIVSLSPEDFNRRFKNSPVKRTKLSGLKRNASFLK